MKQIATTRALAAAASEDQARSLDKAAVWSAKVRGSDNQPNPTITTQTIPVMKAFRAAYLILIVQEC